MQTPLNLASIPDELTLPAVAGFPPLVPMVPFPPAIGRPRSLAAVEAGRQQGLVAWLVKRKATDQATPENLLAVGVLCQVGESFEDSAGRPRTLLRPVARCTWSHLVEGTDQAMATVCPVDRDAVRDPNLEPLAVGMIVQALLGEDDDVSTVLSTATKDVGALADEVLFHLFLSHPPDDALFDLYQQLDPRRRFEGVCDLVGVEPVGLVDHPALEEARRQAEAMLDGTEAPDVAALMDAFFPRVLDEDGTLPVDMVIALGRVIALAGG